MRRKKSKVRKRIEEWTEGKKLDKALRLGPGEAVLVPSRTEMGAYCLTFIPDDPSIALQVGSCKGYRYSKDDSCWHTDKVKGA